MTNTYTYTSNLQTLFNKLIKGGKQMEYSPIKTIQVKNFNCIGDVTLDFEQSPIIALKGGNDVGKSSVIDGFCCSTYNANENNQKDCIRDGTSGFAVVTTLADGTQLTRKKTLKSNTYFIQYPDGSTWLADKIDKGSGVPLKVQEVMGCIKEEETGEFLHIRTYRDKMLFINTSAGTNYKVMYNALKVEHISKAIKKGNEEVNQTKRVIAENEIILDTLTKQYNHIRVYDIDALIQVNERIKKHQHLMKVLEEAVSIKKQIDVQRQELLKYEQVTEKGLTPIDCSMLDKIGQLRKLKQSVTMEQNKLILYANLTKCQHVETSTLDKFSSATKVLKELRQNQKLNIYSGLDKCQPINTTSLSIFEACRSTKGYLNQLNLQLQPYEKAKDITQVNLETFNALAMCHSMLQALQEQKSHLFDLSEQQETLREELKATGVKMVTCNHCGNQVYVE